MYRLEDLSRLPLHTTAVILAVHRHEHHLSSISKTLAWSADADNVCEVRGAPLLLVAVFFKTHGAHRDGFR